MIYMHCAINIIIKSVDLWSMKR